MPKSKITRDIRSLKSGKYLITMIEPVVSADGSQWPHNAMVRYETPATKTNDPINVIGNFVPATFTVSGWRYPVTFTTRAHYEKNFTQLLIDDLTIHAGGIDTQPMESVELLRDLPIGKILKAAAKISAFVATVKPKPLKLADKTIYPARGFIGSANGLNIVSLGADVPQVDLFEMVSGNRKTKRENKPPIYSTTALREIAYWHKRAPNVNGRNGVRVNQWIATQTGGNPNTVQQQITKAREAGHLTKPKQIEKRGKK